jgi:ABC-type transport system involved in Fe-S cluster assembly fused permease/ATPase subunit
MAGEEKLVLVSIMTVAINIGLMGLHFWYSGDWRPFAIIVAFYAAIYAACVVLARPNEWRRRRRRRRKQRERA